MSTTVSSKGQVTLPASVRRRLGIRAGSLLEFVVRSDDVVEMIAVGGSVRDLHGVLGKPARKLTLKQMDAAMSAGASRAARRPVSK
ncbi:MAG: AbrB/MazE/SpoVT family DNA-binding domain-containing protein [Dokdonella sp.]